MPVKNIVSIIALSAVMLLPTGIATAGSVQINNGTSRVKINNGNSRVKIYRNGGLRIKSSSGRVIRIRPSRRSRFYRRRNSAYRPYYGTYRKYPIRTKTLNSRCTGRTYERTVRNRSGSSSSYSYSRTTSCQ